ncbi:MAG: hypothetical protein ACRETG_05540 [Steroidobacteraceae bacterium]
MRIGNVLLGALLVLPAFARADDDRAHHRAPEVTQSDLDGGHHRDRSKDCDERARPVLLETGIHIELAYCGAKPDITTTVGTQDPSSDGKFYTIVTHDIRRLEEDSASHVLVYKPNADWAVPATSLDSMGAIALRQGSMDNSDHTGWVAHKDSRFDQRGQDWLPARQIVMRKPSTSEWLYYRIIRDTRHNLLYVLYQRDDERGSGQENRFFDSFAVDAGAFTVDPGEAGPGAHLPQPYPNP